MNTVIMDQPLASLPFSELFLAASAKMGYTTLQDIISEKPDDLLRKSGFTQHWLSELSRYLVTIDALALIQGIRGSSHA